MGNKRDGDSCYTNALDDEPMFILLARDPHAPLLVSLWASLRHVDINNGTRPIEDRNQANEAELTADKMRMWRRDNYKRWRK